MLLDATKMQGRRGDLQILECTEKEPKDPNVFIDKFRKTNSFALFCLNCLQKHSKTCWAKYFAQDTVLLLEELYYYNYFIPSQI